ncbi:hypothetical protein GDO86_018962 [Hymenochirus boettgeri]|uniref:Protein-tyrosine phosphatase receptor IA-2 ectodomain domain-containing protein n=1 Tax=Hymenochirus boettgeri TaxID=247094 RepID=A0A8T2IFF6_9PIPI|nr:hypothetical protein GDO86_018962 [Hymenochirus boettgeri]
MQHIPEAEPQLSPPDTYPKTSAPSVLPSDLGPERWPNSPDDEGILTATSATFTLRPVPDAQTMGGQPGNLAAAIALEAEGQRILEKKSFQGSGRVGNVPAPSARPGTEDYGYIVTNQKPLSLLSGARLLEILAQRVHLSTSSFINIR